MNTILLYVLFSCSYSYSTDLNNPFICIFPLLYSFIVYPRHCQYRSVCFQKEPIHRLKLTAGESRPSKKEDESMLTSDRNLQLLLVFSPLNIALRVERSS